MMEGSAIKKLFRDARIPGQPTRASQERQITERAPPEERGCAFEGYLRNDQRSREFLPTVLGPENTKVSVQSDL
jgi:hypothetical protein